MPCINRVHDNTIGKFRCTKYATLCDPILCGQDDDDEVEIHMSDACFHCHNLNLDKDCGSCDDYVAPELRVCQVCSAEGYFESHCGEMTGPVTTRRDVIESGMCLSSEGCSAWEYRYPNDPNGCCCNDWDCPVINPDTQLDVDQGTTGFDDIPF